MIILYEDSVLPLGRYKGETVSEVLEKDPDYLVWLQSNSNKCALSDEVMTEVYQATGHSMDEQ